MPFAVTQQRQQNQDQGSQSAGTGPRGGAQQQAPARPGLAHLPEMVRRGSEGPVVRMLQILLTKVGLAPGPIDGVFGPMTHGATVQFQVRRGLSVDGIVGPNTWGALRDRTGSDLDPSQYTAPGGGTRPQHANPTPTHPAAPGQQGSRKPAANPRDEAALRQEILRVAESQIGTVEQGHNRGGATKYQAAFGRGPEPWCADFVSWVYSQAGKNTNAPYCPTFVTQLKKQGRWKGHQNPEPGDLVFFDWDGDRTPDHVGIVKSVNGDGTITTIEGNTANPRNDNQEGVFQKTRDYDPRRGRDMVFGFGSVS